MESEVKTIDGQILESLPLLGEQEKRSLLSVIRSFLSLKEEEEPADEKFLSTYNKELDEAMARIDQGEFYTQAEAEKIASKW